MNATDGFQEKILYEPWSTTTRQYPNSHSWPFSINRFSPLLSIFNHDGLADDGFVLKLTCSKKCSSRSMIVCSGAFQQGGVEASAFWNLVLDAGAKCIPHLIDVGILIISMMIQRCCLYHGYLQSFDSLSLSLYISLSFPALYLQHCFIYWIFVTFRRIILWSCFPC